MPLAFVAELGNAAVGKSGEAVLDVQIGGKALLVKPRIRFGK